MAYETAVYGAGSHLMLGVGENGPLAIDLENHRHLMLLGDNGCGKTATLRTLCREVIRTQTAATAQLFIVDFRRTLLGAVPTEYVGGYAFSLASLHALLPGLVDILRGRLPAADVGEAQLRARSWWAGPEIYLVVDDYDLVATSTGNPMATLLEYLPYAADLGLHVIVARRSGGAARALFEPLLAGLRDLGCLGLMMSGRPDEGPLLGSIVSAPLPPGRGVLIGSGDARQPVQVAWSPPA